MNSDPSYRYTKGKSVYRLKLSEIRKTWGLVSENPGISIRETAKKLGLSCGKTQALLAFLEEGGTIKRERGKARTAVADIPLLTMLKPTINEIKAAGCPTAHWPENCNGMSHAAYGWYDYELRRKVEYPQPT